MTELCFADDAVIVGSTKDDTIRATIEFDRVVVCGLTVSVPNTKLLVAGTHADLYLRGLYVYRALVLGVLLYAVETLPVKQSYIRTLEVFHFHCLKSILGIS